MDLRKAVFHNDLLDAFLQEMCEDCLSQGCLVEIATGLDPRIETLDSIDPPNRRPRGVDKDESPFNHPLCLVAPVSEDEVGFTPSVVPLACAVLVGTDILFDTTGSLQIVRYSTR